MSKVYNRFLAQAPAWRKLLKNCSHAALASHLTKVYEQGALDGIKFIADELESKNANTSSSNSLDSSREQLESQGDLSSGSQRLGANDANSSAGSEEPI